jgi:sulfite reductase alpha subunit-like flavoprotein
LKDTGFETPILLVGAGTGIAPLRALIHEREAVWKRTRQNSQSSMAYPLLCSVAEHILIFGCRKRTCDFYYSNEWEKMTQTGFLKLHPAFSQESAQKIYVQRVLREAEEGTLLVRHILQNRGAIYIAGNCKMAAAVKAEILELLGKHVGGMNESKRIVKKMQSEGLFAIEAWG